MTRVPGTCGELAQGLFNGRDVLITCPISWYSSAKVVFDDSTCTIENSNCKSYQAVNLLLQKYGVERCFAIQLQSDLLKGKGMASSSADIAASLKATADVLQKELTIEELMQIAVQVEPTDGVFFDGVVALDYLKGDFYEHLGNPPAMQIAMFDCGGQIDTILFNQRADLQQLKEENANLFLQSYQLIKEGFRKADAKLIGKGATISALANQKILFKEHLDRIIAISATCGAVGVNVAHSGTLVGVLFDKKLLIDYDRCIRNILHDCADLSYIGNATLIAGGMFT